METYKVIFVSRNDNNDEMEHTVDAIDEANAEQIAQAFLGTQNHFGTIVVARIWNITTNKILNEFEF